MFCKSVIKNPMFRFLFYDHLQGSSFVLSAFTTFRLPASSFVVFGMWPYAFFLYVSGVPVCGLSGRELFTHTHTRPCVSPFVLHKHTYMHTYIYKHMHTHAYIYIHTHTYIYTHTYKYTYTYIRTYILKHIRSYICIYTHTHA
jgi:hypothetical protein